MIQFLFVVVIAITVQSAAAPTKCSNSKSTRGFQVELWQEAAPDATKRDEVLFAKYLNEMLQFACDKQFDRILVTVQDPSQWPSGTVDLYANILASVPDWMEVGFLLNVNPKYAWQWKTDLKNPQGFDSSLLQGITFVHEVNQKAATLGATQKVMIFGGDGENNGLNASNFCTWRDVAFFVMGDDAYAGSIKYMEAKQGSLNGPALFYDAVNQYQDKYNKAPTNCGTLENFLARPELYWYMDELKQKGCIGCPADITLKPTKPEQCTQYQGKLCSGIAACAPFNSFYTNGDIYGQCIAQIGAPNACPEDCCKCFGCVPCGYDQEGKAPNPAIFYQTERSNPSGMKDAIINGINVGHLNDTISLPGTAPMFSIEMSHNLYPDAVQAAGPNNSTDTCMNRHFAGDGDAICGTFDGLGAMTFENLMSTFDLLHKQEGWGVFTIYEWAFVPMSWIEKTKSLVV